MKAPLLYSGSVKDVYGPVGSGESRRFVFEFSDAFSVFDWGRMPDRIARKGEALATLAADWMQQWEAPATWVAFSKTETALALRRANRFGSDFNEWGERLQKEGLRTHLLGVLPAAGALDAEPQPLGRTSVSRMAVIPVGIPRPTPTRVWGRELFDYRDALLTPLPRLVPLEVVFRFDAPAGSSLPARIERDPGYLSGLGFTGFANQGPWDFPVIECFTKLEPQDRVLSSSEALLISGLSGDQFQQMLFQTAWVAGWLRERCRQKGLNLWDGKLEWALSPSGDLFLVDGVGPDELRISTLAPAGDGKSALLSKEWLRTLYRDTPWYEALNRAKREAHAAGRTDWKRAVTQAPPALSPEQRELASQLYLSLANRLGSRPWFEDAWSVEKWAERTR